MGGRENIERKEKVCIIRHSFYPVELNVKREAETLLEDGFEVTVICLRGEGEAPEEVIGGVRVYRMPVGHKRGRIWRYLFEYSAFFILASAKLLSLHLRERFSFVQVNTMPDCIVFVSLVPKLMGARVILHMHEPMPELFQTMFPKWYQSFFIHLLKLSERASLRFADRVLTVTREMRDNLGARGADIGKITVVVNVPDDKSFRPERFQDIRKKISEIKKEERQRGIFRIVCHGAIEERYGLDVVVRALHRLRDDLPGLQFRFMGRGDYLGEILDLAAELRLSDHVSYLGFVPLEEMVGEILAADVCVVPVKKNPYSVLVHTNKMYEYVALGKPVIASRLDAVLSYFPEDSMLYFRAGDDEDLARKIHYVFSHPEEVKARLLSAAEVYETYRWEREKRKYLGVYHALSQGSMVDA